MEDGTEILTVRQAQYGSKIVKIVHNPSSVLSSSVEAASMFHYMLLANLEHE